MKRGPEMGYWGAGMERVAGACWGLRGALSPSSRDKQRGCVTEIIPLYTFLRIGGVGFHSTSLHPRSLTPKQDWGQGGQGVCSPSYKCLGRSPTGVYIYPQNLGCVEAPVWVYSKPCPQVAKQPPLELPQSRLHPLGALLHP